MTQVDLHLSYTIRDVPGPESVGQATQELHRYGFTTRTEKFVQGNAERLVIESSTETARGVKGVAHAVVTLAALQGRDLDEMFEIVKREVGNLTDA